MILLKYNSLNILCFYIESKTASVVKSKLQVLKSNKYFI
jgi:hypothetical protein